MIAGSPPRSVPPRWAAALILFTTLGLAGAGTAAPSGTDAVRSAETAGATQRDRAGPAAAATTTTAKTAGSFAGTDGVLQMGRVEHETDAILERLLPARSDAPADWGVAPSCLHAAGDPRWLAPCVPGPPCDPSLPPHPFDLIGIRGAPTGGPIYRGPCEPRVGSHDCGPAPRWHRAHDWMFDRFYRAR